MIDTSKTARRAGLAYLGLAISGMVGFLLIRSRLLEPGDATATALNLVESEGLARLGIAVDLTIVVTQALAALYFFKLFRGVNTLAAGSLAAFGLINSVAIMIATGFSATALQVAIDGVGNPGAADTALLLYELSGTAWGVGALFFGLWLIPMGWLALRSGLPRALGRILIGGGFGYLLSAYTTYLLPDASGLTDVLTVPATIGELWMIGYLLIKGVRRVEALNDRSRQLSPSAV
jgi:hypothetical protein